MAINKLMENAQGIETTHNVFNLEFNNISNKVSLVWYKYVSADKFNNKKLPVESQKLLYNNLSELPAEVKTKLKEVLILMEGYMVANVPDFTGGQVVKDNGSALPL